MHTHSLPRAAGVALVVSALLAACGTGGVNGPSASDADKAVWLKTVTLAAERTIQAKTARTAVELSESAESTTAKAESTTAKAESTTAKAESTTAKGEGLYDTGTGRVSLSVVDEAGVKDGIVVDRNIVYVAVPPAQRAAIPGRKPWVKIDAAMLTGAPAAGLRWLTQIGNVNPTQGLLLIKGMQRDVMRIGTDTLRGVPTTHYRGNVDRRTLLDSPTAELEPHVKLALQEIASDAFPADVWVDRDDRLRKVRYEMTVRKADGKGNAKRTGTVEFFDFGTTASIAIPEDDEVFDLSRVLGRLKSRTGDRGRN